MANATGEERERLLDPVDRISEILFGLIMAVTIVASMSVATAGRDEVRTVLVGALGCNLAWGLVDALMYLLRTLTERTRNVALANRVLAADPSAARGIIEAALPPHVMSMAGGDEIEGMRRRLVASPPPRGSLHRDDYLAAFGVFVLVVLATFPVVAPFLLTSDAALAMRLSRAISIAMLFLAGYALGRYAGYARPILTGIAMALLGAAVVVIVMALGG